MGTFEKRCQKFNRVPIPNDITFEDVAVLAEHYGCVIKHGGNHTKIVHIESGTVIPIPRHGKFVQEVYIKQLKNLFNALNE